MPRCSQAVPMVGLCVSTLEHCLWAAPAEYAVPTNRSRVREYFKIIFKIAVQRISVCNIVSLAWMVDGSWVARRGVLCSFIICSNTTTTRVAVFRWHESGKSQNSPWRSSSESTAPCFSAFFVAYPRPGDMSFEIYRMRCEQPSNCYK